jgi:hypothetical protein
MSKQLHLWIKKFSKFSFMMCGVQYLCISPLKTEGMNQNRHWNHHRWHATNSLERTRFLCWCLLNHKECTYRAPVRYVTKTWSVVLLNKKYIYSYLKCIVYDKLSRRSFVITLYIKNISLLVLQCKWVLQFPVLFTFTTFLVCIRVA